MSLIPLVQISRATSDYDYDTEVFEYVFEGATYEDLMDNNLPKRPYFIINTTDMATGKVFSFTQDMFDFLCADLTKFKLADAVAASAAYPVLLTALTVKNHNRPDQKCPVSSSNLAKLITDLKNTKARERDRESDVATAKGRVEAMTKALERAKQQRQAQELDVATAEGQLEEKKEELEKAKTRERDRESDVVTAEGELQEKKQELKKAKERVTLLKLEITLSRALSAQPHDYMDEKTQYVHFLDGGIADNLGLTPLLRLLDAIIPQMRSATNGQTKVQNSQTKVPKRIAVIAVNARSNPENDYGKRDTPPNVYQTLVTTTGAAIDSTTFVLIEQLELLRKVLELTNPESKMFIVDVSLDSIKYKGCRHWFQNIPTSWSLEPEQVKALIDIGRALVLDSDDYKGLVKKLGYEKTDETVSQVCSSTK